MVAFACVSACGARAATAPSVPPALVLPVPPAPPPPAGRASTLAASRAFAPVRDRVFGQLLADEPTVARDLGLHDYDGRVAPTSREALAARIARLTQASEDLSRVEGAGLSDDEALDLAELKGRVASLLFWLVDVDEPRKYPQFYEPLFAVNTYLDREYAPIEERAKRLLAHEEAAVVEAVHVRENLVTPLSKPVATVAAKNFAGFAIYLRGDVVRVMGKIGDEPQRGRFSRANEALAHAAEELASWLRVEAAHGDESHVLGAERYARLLQTQEGLTLPLADFERMNEADLAANKAAYEALSARVKDRNVAEASYFSTAETMMQDARRFVVERGIVSLPSSDRVTVRETPPYERWNAASIELSGPFDEVKSAYYYLTLPDRAWPRAEREAYLGTLGNLLGTTIHEVFPGHFVQGRWQERAPTAVQKASDSYSFVEGWAHYAEQMMIDEGFGKDDPANRLAMLHGALLRNCRFAASIGIHTKGMTTDQAAKRFVADCHQDVATAREQAVRGTFDPGYFAYTLGKLQIVSLRDEAKRALGDRFSIGKFHDALLSHGAPPLALVHDRVLAQVGAIH
jgi:uncharacterized protein (DUF885 family)